MPVVARRPALGGRQDRPADDADHLRRDTDPGIAAPHQLLVRVRPDGVGVAPGAHVQPLDDDGAAEVCGGGRAPDDDARPVRRGARVRERPATVPGQSALGPVRGRRSCRDVLVFDVAASRQVDLRGRSQRDAVPAGELLGQVGRGTGGSRRRLRRSQAHGRTSTGCRTRTGCGAATNSPTATQHTSATRARRWRNGPVNAPIARRAIRRPSAPARRGFGGATRRCGRTRRRPRENSKLTKPWGWPR